MQLPANATTNMESNHKQEKDGLRVWKEVFTFVAM